MRNTNTDQPGHPGDVRVQEFLDMIAPSVIKFNTDHFICGTQVLHQMQRGQMKIINPC